MKAFAIGSSFVIGMLAVVSCSSDIDDEALSNDGAAELNDEGPVGTTQQPITKGKPGAVNGAADYCNTVTPCTQGEGDCDSTAQCAAGLVCAADNGPKFGFGSGWDVCVPAHCTNKTLDGDETSADCGGSCGTCSTCVGVPGTANFCVGCLCSSGQGDCDSSTECASGLTCGQNNGPVFGLPVGYDVCVAPHCLNGVLDAASGETGIDDGGPCGARAGSCTGTPNTVDYCVGCLCSSGQGDCDSDAECASGLVCAPNNGLKFGLSKAYDLCVPAHCTNKTRDAGSGEVGVDVGGPCGAVAAYCSNHVKDGDETQVDCGGSCASCATPSGTCGNGTVNGPSITSIKYDWLMTCESGRSIDFTINGSPSLSSARGNGCTCTPGLQTQTLTDPSLLALVHGGTNSFSVKATDGIAFAWAKVTLTFADSTVTTLVLDDTDPAGSAESNESNLCSAGFSYNRGTVTKSLGGLAGEECDDGNVVSGDTCNADCTLPG